MGHLGRWYIHSFFGFSESQGMRRYFLCLFQIGTYLIKAFFISRARLFLGSASTLAVTRKNHPRTVRIQWSPRLSFTWLVVVFYIWFPPWNKQLAPENWWLERWSFPFRMVGWPIFRAMLVFRSCKTLFGWAIWNSRFYICDLPNKVLQRIVPLFCGHFWGVGTLLKTNVSRIPWKLMVGRWFMSFQNGP